MKPVHGLQSIRRGDEFAKIAMRKFPIAETVKAKPGQYNLHELIGRFPQRGVGLKVMRKHWPDNTYWEVLHAQQKPDKNLRLYGVKYWNGKLVSQSVQRIRDQ